MEHKKLMIMRHGKSNWESEQSDFERPLNQRGKVDVVKIAEELKRLKIVPDRIVSSSAARAVQTTNLIKDTLGLNNKIIDWRSELYLASSKQLLSTIESQINNSCTKLMLVAHNPGLDDIVCRFADAPPRRTATGKLMTTAAVAIFDVELPFDIDKLSLQIILRPKELNSVDSI